MIIGIGTDIAIIKRIAAALKKQEKRFLARAFSAEEISAAARYTNETARAGHFAKRWAAKEAVAKAMRTGIRDDIVLRDIIVLNDSIGAPSVKMQGGAAKALKSLTPRGKTADIHLTLADDGGMAIAVAVIYAVDKPKTRTRAAPAKATRRRAVSPTRKKT